TYSGRCAERCRDGCDASPVKAPGGNRKQQTLMVRVSVILPTYNRLDSLRAACESVLNQSFRDLELLVVDDASSEDIQPMIQELGDDRLHYIRRGRNGGAAAARNTGLTSARGEY